MLSKSHATRIELGKVLKSRQKYIIRIAKKQRQFQKLCFNLVSKWQVTGIESGEVCKSLQNFIIRIAKKQEQLTVSKTMF